MGKDHSWMYNGWDKNGDHSDEWMTKTMVFLNRAFSRTKMVRCPCSRCQNTRCLKVKKTVVIDLCKYDFVIGYEMWIFHYKKVTQIIEEEEEDYSTGVDRMAEMLEAIETEIPEDAPTKEVEPFFKL
jgi:hypothetical protein